MCKVIDQFYVEQVDASFITLSENMPKTKFSKVKIGSAERSLVPFHIRYKEPSMDKMLRTLAIEGGGDLVGKEVLFV